MSLSPAYDITPTPAQYGVSTHFRLAMSVGEQGREATVENALSRAARFGYTMEGAMSVVATLLPIIRDWRKHFEERGVSGRDIDLLAPSFQ